MSRTRRRRPINCGNLDGRRVDRIPGRQPLHLVGKADDGDLAIGNDAREAHGQSALRRRVETTDQVEFVRLQSRGRGAPFGGHKLHFDADAAEHQTREIRDNAFPFPACEILTIVGEGFDRADPHDLRAGDALEIVFVLRRDRVRQSDDRQRGH